MLRKIVVIAGLFSVLGASALFAEAPAPVEAAAAQVAEHPGQIAEHAAAEAGEHGEALSWFTMLFNDQQQRQLRTAIASNVAAKSLKDHEDFVEQGQLTHVFMAAIAFALVLLGALVSRRVLSRDPDAGVLPARKVSVFMFFELIIGAVWNLMKNMMGEAEAKRHFPIVGTLALYIFAMNALALLPGGAPPTANLNTNIVMGLTVFLATHISGLRVQGPVGYAKHFAGPILAMAPLMIVIEVISHCVRPISLSLRLLGNMTGDHKVLDIFLGFHIPLLPLPMMALGLLVVCIQTLVFVLLSTVYLSMAVAHHDHDEGHEAHGAPGGH